MEDEEEAFAIPDAEKDERKPRQFRTFKEAVEHTITDARSQALLTEMAKRRADVIPDPTAKDFREDKDGIEGRLENSDRVLSELLRDGSELISNIRIANDKREVDRRIKEAELREELLENLQNESIEARNKLEAITIRWGELDEVKDPMGMFEGLENQKNRIRELMDQKDEIIKECRKELDAADVRYILDQEKQNSDIQCLVERIDNQIEVMKKAYREHLELLESTIQTERNRLRRYACRRWDEMYQNRARNEESKLQKEKETAELYAQEIADLALQHEELTRSTRIRLEMDNQALEVELQKTKANVLLNSEKLDYNYQVLKKREDENVVIRNQQKRRLGRLYETISKLKKKIRDRSTVCDGEASKLTSEVVKLHEGIKELEKKAEVFTEANEKKYQNVWDMNYEECVKQLEKVLTIDKILTEQQLGLDWHEPEMNLMNKEDLPSYKSAVETIKSETESRVSGKKKNLTIMSRRNSFKDISEKRLLRHILQRISDKTEFLVEEKVFELLKPYTAEQKSLVCLDNVFNALGINRVEDINSLKDYFLPFTFCIDCQTFGPEAQSLDDLRADKEEKKVQAITYSDAEQPEGAAQQAEFAEITRINNCLQSGHILMIESVNVLEALREFTKVHTSAAEEVTTIATLDENAGKLKTTISRLLAPHDVQEFWSKFEEVLTPEKEKVWASLEYGLTHYLKVLKEREELDHECEFLRKQNTELKHLMQKFVPK